MTQTLPKLPLLTPRLTWIMAIASGVSESAVGLVATMTQIGLAFGLLFSVLFYRRFYVCYSPAHDSLERRPGKAKGTGDCHWESHERPLNSLVPCRQRLDCGILLRSVTVCGILWQVLQSYRTRLS